MASGATAVVSDVAGVDLINHGIVQADYGANTMVGGVGVELSAYGTIANTGTIAGGSSQYSNGGAGIDLVQGGKLNNSGHIFGRGSMYGSLVSAGAGVIIGGGSLFNSGQILGGDVSPETLGYGGIGVELTSATRVSNAGMIAGGAGYTRAGDGLQMERGGNLVNHGDIIGGLANGYTSSGGTGGIGVDFELGGTLSNSGTIEGGEGFIPGDGLLATTGAIVANSGTIEAGISFGLTKTSDIGPSTGVGVDLAVQSKLLNAGVILGSNGANSLVYYGGYGGPGLNAIYLASSSSVENKGQVIGGYGGNAPDDGKEYGGNGGDGAFLTSLTTLTNDGTISGGAGGNAFYNSNYFNTGGNGGVGVYINGGTLIDRGTISGGAGGDAYYYHGLPGDAVQFGSNGGTLEISKSSVFNGLVAANPSVNDVLILNPGGLGTMTGLGVTNFTGFTTVKDAGDWIFKGADTIAGGGTLIVQGTLSVSGTLTDAGAAQVDATLDVIGTGTAQLASLVLSGGTLSVGHQSTLVVGANLADAKPGRITLDAGLSITGYGVIGDAAAIGIVDDAAIFTSANETLSFLSPVTGSGTITIGSSSQLLVAVGLHTPSVVFSSGSGEVLGIDPTGSVTSTLTGFSGTDIIDERQQTVTSVLFSNGTLTLLDGHVTVETLFLAGNFNTASFDLKSDGHGGTDIVLAGKDAGFARAPHLDTQAGVVMHELSGRPMLDHNSGPNFVFWLDERSF